METTSIYDVIISFLIMRLAHVLEAPYALFRIGHFSLEVAHSTARVCLAATAHQRIPKDETIICCSFQCLDKCQIQYFASSIETFRTEASPRVIQLHWKLRSSAPHYVSIQVNQDNFIRLARKLALTFDTNSLQGRSKPTKFVRRTRSSPSGEIS